MKKQHLEHILRAAGVITSDHQFIVVGSQSILGKYPDAPDDLLHSVEVDIFAKNKTEKTDFLNAIGEDSPFHEMYGYYADPVDESTCVLPKGWKGRLVNVCTPQTNGVTGLCLDPHDLILSKFYAGRDKDFEFNRCAIKHGLVDKDKLASLLQRMDITSEHKDRISAKILLYFRSGCHP